jgi:hypothetical protein
MKNLMFVLALTVGTFIPGCQENAVDPFTESAAPSLEKAAPAPVVYPIVIPINVSLQDPRPGPGPVSLLMLKGSVGCSLTDVVTSTDAVTSLLPVPVTKVDLATNIFITPFGIGTPDSWKVSATSSDYVAVPLNDACLLQKNYIVSGTAGLVLHITLKVTREMVTLSEIWLTITPMPMARVDY